VPYAYFAFGEMFFVEGAGDPSKYLLAQQAFTKVTTTTQERELIAYAVSRLADAYDRTGGDGKAPARRVCGHARPAREHALNPAGGRNDVTARTSAGSD
jgi:hypothetical protein